MFDGGEDRGRVVRGMVDHEWAAEKRGEDQRGNARAGAELVVGTGGAVLAWRRNVVPLAAELVIDDHDQRALRTGAAFDRLQQLDEMVAADLLAGIPGVLVLLTDGLDEADR